MEFLLTPLREGRLYLPFPCRRCFAAFLLTPLREGRQIIRKYFGLPEQFLLTPLREGRLDGLCDLAYVPSISTHAPAGGATRASSRSVMRRGFLLTPLREGRQTHTPHTATSGNFYSRPCGRGDARDDAQREAHAHFYSRPCGRGDGRAAGEEAVDFRISTHAPAGGATAACRGHSRPAEHFYSRPCGRGDLKNRVRTSGSALSLRHLSEPASP